MKALTTLVLGLVLALPAWVRAEAAPPPPAPSKPVLAVLIVDSLHSVPLYNRMAYHFERVFEKQHWPVAIKVDRFAANNEPHDLELLVFYQGIRNDFGGEKTYRAWMTLNDHGVKHDFGMVECPYQPRPGMLVDDMLDAIFAGAAQKAASLVGPYLAPPASTSKP